MPSHDAAVWQQRVALNLSLFQALALHAHLLLALRHPGAAEPGLTRETVEETVAVLSRLLLHHGALTAAEVRDCFTVEAGAHGMTWEAFDVACARLEARVAARGQRHPDTEG
jgi:hypothetical protein